MVLNSTFSNTPGWGVQLKKKKDFREIDLCPKNQQIKKTHSVDFFNRRNRVQTDESTFFYSN